jgi:hypothetical protein
MVLTVLGGNGLAPRDTQLLLRLQALRMPPGPRTKSRLQASGDPDAFGPADPPDNGLNISGVGTERAGQYQTVDLSGQKQKFQRLL